MTTILIQLSDLINIIFDWSMDEEEREGAEKLNNSKENIISSPI